MPDRRRPSGGRPSGRFFEIGSESSLLLRGDVGDVGAVSVAALNPAIMWSGEGLQVSSLRREGSSMSVPSFASFSGACLSEAASARRFARRPGFGGQRDATGDQRNGEVGSKACTEGEPSAKPTDNLFGVERPK